VSELLADPIGRKTHQPSSSQQRHASEQMLPNELYRLRDTKAVRQQQEYCAAGLAEQRDLSLRLRVMQRQVLLLKNGLYAYFFSL
jgi:hypothetical protein